VPGHQSIKQTSLRSVDRAKELSHIIAILHKWGVHTLGDLAALPPDQLGARLGPRAVLLWEQATGRATRLLRLVRPTEVFAEEIEFDYEIKTAEPLLFVLRRFLEQLTLRLGALYLVAREMTFQLTFADQSHYAHRFHIPDPTNSVEILFRLLQTHLEAFRAEHPIVAVSLAAEASRPARQQFHLFETPLRDPNRLHETLTQLTGLLGKKRVGRPVLEDTHRPDAFHLEAFSWQLPSSPNEFRPMMGPALRRLRAVFSPALAAAAVARQGPYRTSGDWWDAKKWERTEWDLQLEDGVVCRCRERREGWGVEGIYD
jgi:impB/mucB/samB family C-terminal domain